MFGNGHTGRVFVTSLRSKTIQMETQPMTKGFEQDRKYPYCFTKARTTSLWMLTAYVMYMSVYCIGWFIIYDTFFNITIHEMIARGRKRFFLDDFASNITHVTVNGTLLKYDLHSNENILVGFAEMAFRFKRHLDYAVVTMFFCGALSTTFWSASKRFQHFLSGIDCSCAESATRTGSSHSFEEEAKIMEKYTELRNLLASLNSLWSTMTLLYVICRALDYTFNMKRVIESKEFSEIFAEVNWWLFFIVMLVMLAEGCRINGTIKIWLCKKGYIREEVFSHRKTELECLERSLEIEPVGIGAVGVFEINYGFLAHKTECKWTPRDYEKAIRRNKEPEDSWSTYPVRVLSKNPIRDYKTARNLEKTAEFTSSLETTDADCERRKNQRRAAKPKEPCLALVRDSASSSDNPQSDQSSRNSVSVLSLIPPSDVEENSHIEEDLQALGQLRELIDDLTSEPSANPVSADRAHLVPNDTIHLSSSEYTALYNRQIAFEKQVMTGLAGIRADIRELLQRTCSKPTTDDLPRRRIPFDFICQTIELLMSLNEWIKAADNFSILWILMSKNEKLEILLNDINAFSLFHPAELSVPQKLRASKRTAWLLTAYVIYMSVCCIVWIIVGVFFKTPVLDIIAIGRKRFYLENLKSNIIQIHINDTLVRNELLYSIENILVGSAELVLGLIFRLLYVFVTIFFCGVLPITFWFASKRFEHFLSGIDCFCKESAIRNGSFSSSKAVMIMGKYIELRNLLASLNSVCSTMTLFYVVCKTVEYIFNLNQFIQSKEISSIFFAVNFRLFFVVMLVMIAEGCSTNASIKLWLCKRGYIIHEEVFPPRKNELECLNRTLETEPVGIGAFGMFEINYVFLAQLLIFSVTALLITF
ncbi:unnamed protein product [Orchesella dallaii]|uniref:Gustatory receptor n=1 Tax=Orchesella dallaii TaxID=48710 RepID=A0ABP1S1M2_9HEXA